MDPQFFLFLLLVSAGVVVWKSGPVIASWMRARRSGAPLPLWRLWRMFFCNVPLQAVTDAHIFAVQAGVDIELNDLVAHALAGGDTRAAVYAYIETRRAGTAVEFAHVCDIELSEPEADEVVLR